MPLPIDIDGRNPKELIGCTIAISSTYVSSIEIGDLRHCTHVITDIYNRPNTIGRRVQITSRHISTDEIENWTISLLWLKSQVKARRYYIDLPDEGIYK